MINFGDKVTTVGEFRDLLSEFDDRDIMVLETTDKHGDAEDLYPFYLDVYDNIQLQHGLGHEIRICQIRPDVETTDMRIAKDVVCDCLAQNGSYVKRFIPETCMNFAIYVSKHCCGNLNMMIYEQDLFKEFTKTEEFKG
ncbi:MAG TPA: hypothetical protein VK172_10360 [Lentimicrobium sp.]|nr:hypothetical protein [Lentimicrobium sp.]